MDTAQLGRKLGTFTIDWFTLAIWYAILGIIIMTVVNGGDLNLDNTTLLWGLVAGYYILMLILRQMRPRIHLYEEGVFVMDRGKKSLWTWDELTHFEGMRHSMRVNGIPVMRTGANQFFAGDVPAFRLGALTGNADILADYSLSRMAEKHIPALAAQLRKGEKVEYGGIDISSQGIGNAKDFYMWEQIEAVKFSNDSYYGGIVVRLKLSDKRFLQSLGTLGGIQGYVMMGLVDSLRGTKHLPAMQDANSSLWRRVQRNMGDNKWLFAIIAGLILVALCIIVMTVANTK